MGVGRICWRRGSRGARCEHVNVYILALRKGHRDNKLRYGRSANIRNAKKEEDETNTNERPHQ